MPLVGDKKRAYDVKQKALRVVRYNDIGEPVISSADKRRGTVLRNACRKSLLKFNTLCFPNSTGLKPFGQVQLDSIAHDQDVILNGGRVCKAEPRAFGKTTRTTNAALWAALYNRRKMIPVFSANMEKSKHQIMARWKTELYANDLLYAMFPFLIWPFRKLGNKPQAAASQTYRGELTRVAWTADRIVFPTIPNQPASGNVLIALPLGSARGATHSTPDGTVLRPDLCIFDDVQTDEDADNPNTIKKLEDLIDHTALMLGGHSQTMSAIMNCTVRKLDDLSETYLKKPGWRHVRYKMLDEPSKREKELWLGEYADIRRNYDPESPTDQRRANKEALQFYLDNRQAMDEGAIVTWEWAYAWADGDPTEVSAVQHAYNILIDLGESVFLSECQNQPHRDSGGLEILSTAEMMRKQSGYPRNEFPKECTTLTAFVDVHEQIHYYEIWAWEPNFTGYLIDFGAMPDQIVPEWKHDSLKFSLERYFPGMDDAARITAGLKALLFGHDEMRWIGLLQREWQRADGAVLKIAKCGIDANGAHSDAIKRFIRAYQIGGVMYPSYGRGVKATEMPLSRWTKAKKSSTGPEWVETKGSIGDTPGAMFDTNFWKAQFHRKLALPEGSQGAIYLFKAEPETHRMGATHYRAEHPKEVTYAGRVVYEFPPKIKGDNHRFDCAVGNLVAASKAGIRSIPISAKKASGVSLAELQRRRWQREGRV